MPKGFFFLLRDIFWLFWPCFPGWQLNFGNNYQAHVYLCYSVHIFSQGVSWFLLTGLLLGNFCRWVHYFIDPRTYLHVSSPVLSYVTWPVVSWFLLGRQWLWQVVISCTCENLGRTVPVDTASALDPLLVLYLSSFQCSQKYVLCPALTNDCKHRKMWTQNRGE